MIIFLDARGNIVTPPVPEPIGRGSNDANTIYIVAPLSSSANIYMTFTLPNGEALFGGLAENVRSSYDQADGLQASYLFTLPDSELSVWKYLVKSTVTRLSGVVQYTVVTVTSSMRATSPGTFTVSKGGRIKLPEKPTESAWHDILAQVEYKNADLDLIMSTLFGDGEGGAGLVSKVESVKQKSDRNEENINDALEKISAIRESVPCMSLHMEDTPLSYVFETASTYRESPPQVIVSGRALYKLVQDGVTAEKATTIPPFSRVVFDLEKRQGAAYLQNRTVLFDIVGSYEDNTIRVLSDTSVDDIQSKIDKSAIVDNIDGTSPNLVLSQRGLFKCFIPRPSDSNGLQDGAVEGVYARNESEGKDRGYERLIPVNRGNAAGNIPYMSASASYGQSDGGGYLNTSDPEYPFNCANKRYTDGMSIAVSMSADDYKLTVSLLNYYGQVLSSKVIDLPLETTVSNAEVSEDGTTLTITFRNGSVVSFGVPELAKGLITKEEADRTYVSKISTKAGKNIPWYDTSTGEEGAYIPAYGAIGGSLILRDVGGEVIVGVPKQPEHATPKQYVDEGFVKKLSASENAAGMNVYTNTISADGTSVDVARKLYWNDGGNEPTVAYNGGMPQYANGYIPVRTPTEAQPYAAANKKYVDEEITKVEALLGKLIKSVEVVGHQDGWSVPEGVLPNFYFPSTEVTYTTGDDYENSETATTHIKTLYFYDENFSLLGSEAAISGTYYEMPSGTVRIGNDFNEQIEHLDPPFNYMVATPCRLTFIVKVGD